MDRERALRLLSILTLPPPNIDELFQAFFQFVNLIIPPPDPLLDIRHRLFGHLENHWVGKNVFQTYANHPYEFFECTGETPESMLALLNDIGPRILNGRHLLSPRNRLLMLLLWLRSYPSYSLLSLIFDISIATVGNEIECIRPLVWDALVGEIAWPSIQDWQSYRGYWSDLPDAVGAIDCTSHEIYRPITEPQQPYYSRHRHFHCIHTVVIIDNQCNLRYVHSGFLGHQNDAQIFNFLPIIGPQQNLELQFPGNCFLLGDKIFANSYPIMTPYRGDQILKKPLHLQRKCRKLNKIIQKYRVKVEHGIRDIKIDSVLSPLYRHPRATITSVVQICASLSIRRKRLFN